MFDGDGEEDFEGFASDAEGNNNINFDDEVTVDFHVEDNRKKKSE